MFSLFRSPHPLHDPIPGIRTYDVGSFLLKASALPTRPPERGFTSYDIRNCTSNRGLALALVRRTAHVVMFLPAIWAVFQDRPRMSACCCCCCCCMAHLTRDRAALWAIMAPKWTHFPRSQDGWPLHKRAYRRATAVSVESEA